MSTLHLTVGIPASGKSTWAKSWVAEDQVQRLRVNRDETRLFLNIKHGENEPFVTSVQQHAVRAGLKAGKDVVVDDTNLVPKFAKEWLKIAAECDAEVVWHEEFLLVPFTTCLDRDQARGEARVGHDVLVKMAQRAKSWRRPTMNEPDLSGFKPYHGTPGKPKVFLVDIDGTIASNGPDRQNPARGYYDWHKVGTDLPIPGVINVVRHCMDAGLFPLFVSGRDKACFSETWQWIKENVRPEWFDWNPQLHMRDKGDMRRDDLVKLEIFDREIRDDYDVQFAIDDRDQVVRAYRDILKLTVFQCAPGDF